VAVVYSLDLDPKSLAETIPFLGRAPSVLKSLTNGEDRRRRRRLQDNSPPSRATVVIDKCVFENHVCLGDDTAAVFATEQTDLTVQQTEFRNNDYSACSGTSVRRRASIVSA
jgi:hypothetical protein